MADAPLSGLVGNRYQVERLLGEGGMGAVYLVLDRLKENAPRALKTLPPILDRPETLDRLKAEFEILAKLSHPNLARVYDFAFDPGLGRPYFTAEYIEGRDLGTAGKDLSPLELANLAVQVLRGLAYLHARRVIHFDVKPSNILVSPDRASAKLIDFGLAGARASERFGTPGFIAPEIVRKSEADLRADLYSLGVTLYQVAAGQNPFAGSTTLTTVRRQMADLPDPPSRFNPEVPRPLEDVILRLMAKDPADRFASAREVIAALNEGLGLSHEIETVETAEGHLLTPRFVGREGELGRLKELFHRSVEAGPPRPDQELPGLVVVTGGQGLGKARLCLELRWYAQLRNVSFVTLDATAGPASDFSAMAAAVLQVMAAAGADDPACRRWGRAVADLLLGQGTREDGPSSSSPLFERLARFFVDVSQRRPLVLLCRGLDAMGADASAFLDHLGRLVRLWRREGDPAAPEARLSHRPRLMLVATSQAPPADTTGCEVLGLEELPEPSVTEMVQSVLGQTGDAETLAGLLYRELGGNPLAVTEALRFLLAEGLIAAGSRGWTVDLARVERPGGVPAASQAMAVRTGRLPRERRRVLELLAVVDEPLSLALLVDLAEGETAARLYGLCKELEADGFLASYAGPEGMRFGLAHSRLRQVVYDAMDRADCRDLHARAAVRFEAGLAKGRDGAEDWSRLANHFFHARLPERAAPYARKAAAHFDAIRLFDEAARYYRILLDCTADPDDRWTVRLDLAQALYSASRYRDSVDLVEEAARKGPVSRKTGLRLHQLLARSYAGMGLYAEALRHLAEVRERLGADDPLAGHVSYHTLSANIHTHQGRYGEARALCEEALSRVGAGRHPELEAQVLDCQAFLYRVEGDLTGALALQKRVYGIVQTLEKDAGMAFQAADGLCVIHHLLGDFRESLRWGHRALRLARAMEDLQAQCTAYGNLAMNYTSLGRLEKALDRFTRANRLAERTGDTHKLGVSFFNMANVLDGLGRHRQGTGPYLRAIDLSEKAGDRFLAGLARACFAWHHLLLWDLEGARKALTEAEAGEAAMENRFLTAMVTEVKSRLALHEGRVDEALALLEPALETYDALEHAERLIDARLHKARVLAALGELRAAQQAVREAEDAAERRGLRAYQAEAAVLSGEVLLARNRVAEGESRLRAGATTYERMGSPVFAARALLKLAASQAGRGNAESARATLGLARPAVEGGDVPALAAEHDLVAGSLALCPGGDRDPDAAVRFLEQARERAEGAGAARVAARVQGELDRARGEAGRRAGILPAADPPAGAKAVGLEGDVQRLLEVIALMGREHNLDAVLSTVLDAAIDLTGAQRGFLILGEDWGGDPELADLDFVTARNFDREEVRSPAFKISRSVAMRAARLGEPVLVRDAAQDADLADAGSVQRLALRSVVCVPLREPGRVLGVLYLDNRFEAGAFAERHLVLLSSLAQQAAVAVARARLYRGVLDERKRAEELNARLGELNRELQETVKTQILEISEIRREIGEKTRELSLRYDYSGMVGKSKAMERLYRELDRVIDTDLPVLIVGPTGSGKELVAKTVHFQSGRRDGRLVTENCAAVPESLLESELFGHQRGAFTDARDDRKGLLELASGGTLFLDEIGDMSPAMQKKLLRALEQKEVRPVGGEQPVPVDIRVIAATNRDLARAVEDGSFREDLYFRLNACTVRVPALKERPEDIPLLVDHFLDHFASVKGLARPDLPKRVVDALLAYDWPGNVRELKNEVERLVALSRSGKVVRGDLSPHLQRKAKRKPVPAAGAPGKDFESAVARFEVELLRRALEENDWNVVQAARQLGIGRMKLSRKMKKYDLEKPQ